MDNTLVRFFNKINFEYSDSFMGATVLKVAVNKQKETWKVYLSSPKVINVEEMIKLFDKANEGLIDVEKIDIVMNYEEVTNEDIINYVKFFLNEKINENPSLSSIKDNKLEIIDNKIDIEVISKIEQSLLSSFNKELTKLLDKFGLNKVELNQKINL